jgi:class 3 adenylate cyclase/tetratricopeptide (TPR) repeat protein
MSDQPAPRARRSSAEIANLLNSVKVENLSQLSDLTRQETTQPSAPVRADNLNPELKTYLTPDLWRKLNEDNTRRGLFNNALDRMQSLLYTISTYLPGDLVREKMKDPKVGRVNGKILKGCLLFSDVSGFTALSERLAALGPKGAEHLTEVINRYFTEMIDILSRSNGTLLKFAGDATLVFFPEQENGEHVRWAARAGLRMMRAMQKFTDLPTPLGPVTITMKIGLSAGSFLAASVGSEKRMEYVLVGPTVSQALQAEGCTRPGDIVTNEHAASLLSTTYEMTELKTGFFLLNPSSEEKLDGYEIITQTQKFRSRGSAVQWDTNLEEIKSEVNEKLNQVRALTPYLASELVDRIIVHADQRQVQSEYRPTTVMFCNFTGPDTLLEMWGEAGAKRVTDLLSDYFTAMNEVITRFGGIVSRIDPYSQGNKLLALFGAPIAHEDDAQRAISAALEMNNALLKLNQEWAQNLSRHLPPGSKQNFVEHRIGITLGDTFAGQAGASTRREYTVMGDEVNLAARLMSTARPGQILISQPVFEVTDTYYVSRKLPSVRVKGKKNLIEIWQVDGPREDTLLNRIQSRLPLIGRTSELERGWQVIQNARAGKGSVLTLAGQAGMGKSHLADTLLKRALEDGWQVHAFQCRSYLAGESYSSWKGVLRSLAGITSIDHLLIQKEKLERLAKQLNLPAEQTIALLKVMKLNEVRSASESTLESGKWDIGELLDRAKIRSGEFSRKAKNSEGLKKLVKGEVTDHVLDAKTIQRWQMALAVVLSTLSAEKPLILFFEDVQWMDADSKACLETLRRKTSDQPLLFLLALRTQETDRRKSVERIDLTPFSKIETRSMIAEILTAGLVDIIHEQSNGSPLYVEEISRWIKRTHSIDDNRLKEILQTSDILQKLVLSRLESLPEGQREVARLASVIGVEFHNSEVKALLQTETIDPTTLHEYLNDLIKTDLIILSEHGVDKRYTFAQPIFRDILYASLPFERRSELHNRMAKHLAQLPTQRKLRDKITNFLEDESDPLQDAERLVYHYEMSEQWLEAARQLIHAAENFKQPQNTVESLYARALKLLEHYPPEKADVTIGQEKAHVQLALGNAALERLDLAAAAAAYESSLAALSAGASDKLVVNATGRLCLILPSQGKTESAQKYLARALERQSNDWRLLAVSAWLAWRSGQDARPQIEACRASLPGIDTNSTLRVRVLMDDLEGHWRQAAESYQSLNESNPTALAWVQLGDQLLKQKKPTEAAEQYERAAEIWQGVDFCGLALTRYRLAEMEWQARHPTKALTLLKEALALLEKSAPVLQTEPRSSIQKALTRVNSKSYGEWKYWRWQPFDDLMRIKFCFPLFQETK